MSKKFLSIGLITCSLAYGGESDSSQNQQSVDLLGELIDKKCSRSIENLRNMVGEGSKAHKIFFENNPNYHGITSDIADGNWVEKKINNSKSHYESELSNLKLPAHLAYVSIKQKNGNIIKYKTSDAVKKGYLNTLNTKLKSLKDPNDIALLNEALKLATIFKNHNYNTSQSSDEDSGPTRVIGGRTYVYDQYSDLESSVEPEECKDLKADFNESIADLKLLDMNRQPVLSDLVETDMTCSPGEVVRLDQKGEALFGVPIMEQFSGTCYSHAAAITLKTLFPERNLPNPYDLAMKSQLDTWGGGSVISLATDLEKVIKEMGSGGWIMFSDYEKAYACELDTKNLSGKDINVIGQTLWDIKNKLHLIQNLNDQERDFLTNKFPWNEYSKDQSHLDFRQLKNMGVQQLDVTDYVTMKNNLESVSESFSEKDKAKFNELLERSNKEPKEFSSGYLEIVENLFHTDFSEPREAFRGIVRKNFSKHFSDEAVEKIVNKYDSSIGLNFGNYIQVNQFRKNLEASRKTFDLVGATFPDEKGKHTSMANRLAIIDALKSLKDPKMIKSILSIRQQDDNDLIRKKLMGECNSTNNKETKITDFYLDNRNEDGKSLKKRQNFVLHALKNLKTAPYVTINMSQIRNGKADINDTTAPHAVALIGYRGTSDGKCEYLIQNSGGGSEIDQTISPNGSNDIDSEVVGKFWISESQFNAIKRIQVPVRKDAK